MTTLGYTGIAGVLPGRRGLEVVPSRKSGCPAISEDLLIYAYRNAGDVEMEPPMSVLEIRQRAAARIALLREREAAG